MSLKADFLRLRREVIEKEYERLNDMQRKAVLASGNPLLILAGAGSGKTTVIVEKVACLLRFGDAYNSDEVCFDPTEDDVAELKARLAHGAPLSDRVTKMLSVDAPKPWQVLAITFTNKAANELKERIALSCGAAAGQDVWASTFHSACVRILRREIELLGYNSNFTIYDADDSKRVLKDAAKALNMDENYYKPSAILNTISSAKASLIDSDQFYEQYYGSGDLYYEKVAEIYKRYSESLKNANALDFDDILNLTVKLFKEYPEKLEYWRNKFRYVFVDEYQDTSEVQFLLVYLLTKESRSICVVGDDDQSIYKFRGATIRNILDFEKRYQDAITIRLEQNYRSTGNILDAANAVISHNTERKGKNLWTEKPKGERITLHISNNQNDEADYIAACALKHQREGGKLSDCAVLYRTNAQSRALEIGFKNLNVPYRLVGGTRFRDRKEIKDIMSYLCVIANPTDDLRLKRIINTPKRGIGDITVETIERIAIGIGEPMFNVIKNAAEYPSIERAKNKLIGFYNLLDELICDMNSVPFEDIARTVAEKSGYIKMLSVGQDREDIDRLNNVEELNSDLLEYKRRMYENGEEPTLSGYLEESALVSDIDNYDQNADAVVLMTMHNAKGLEFNEVFITGMEEEVFFPSHTRLGNDAEEERRLMYVGITRAKEKLFLTRTVYRDIYGKTERINPVRFIDEIPESLLQKDGVPEHKYSNSSYYNDEYGFFVKPAKPSVYTGFGGFSVGRSSYAGGGPRKPAQRTAPAAQEKKPAVSFAVGDRVKHDVFGEGTVLSATPMGGDQMLEVAFPVGKKKIMAKFAPIKKV